MTLVEHQLAFAVETHERGPWAVVEARGELDAYTAPSLGAALAAAIDDAGRARVVVHLSEVSFVDAAGLGTLVAASEWARAGGGELRLVGRPRLARLLTLAGLDQVLPLTASIEAALSLGHGKPA